MKVFKHKPTGRIFERNKESAFYEDRMTTARIPISIVEEGTDWEEVDFWKEFKNQPLQYYKQEPEVPPGIVAFRNADGMVSTKDRTEKIHGRIIDYNEWVQNNLQPWPNNLIHSTIHTISVNGVEWSVGDSFLSACGQTGTIKKFQYFTGYFTRWEIEAKTDRHESAWFAVDRINKIPVRKPVVTLQGKDMFEGDEVYLVLPSWSISIIKLENKYYPKQVGIFHSLAMAEQYIRDNKPLYPAALVEGLMLANTRTCIYLKDPQHDEIITAMSAITRYRMENKIDQK